MADRIASAFFISGKTCPCPLESARGATGSRIALGAAALGPDPGVRAIHLRPKGFVLAVPAPTGKGPRIEPWTDNRAPGRETDPGALKGTTHGRFRWAR